MSAFHPKRTLRDHRFRPVAGINGLVAFVSRAPRREQRISKHRSESKSSYSSFL